ncbi:5601_t:CDS:2 [Scutellospora calospora]|uniref:5601_t:CDS:1 n=1 Tax=Scutellospora calospora TaxID=85575 RepID=A0ACA9K9E7_9GLOM|nr:5601_t:CDS:2 [Scutellospora calospora]
MSYFRNFETSAPELCKLATRILSIPSLSAASKYNWSAFSYIYKKKRAQLTNERVLKLVYIYSNYKLICLRQECSDIAKALAQLNNRTTQPLNQRDIEILDPVENDDLNDSYEKILVENANEELIEDYSNIEETDSKDIDYEEIDSENK